MKFITPTLLYLIFLSCCSTIYANSDIAIEQHRQQLTDFSLLAYELKTNLFWLSELNVENDPSYFTSSSGHHIIKNSWFVTSAYDPSYKIYDVRDFYKPKSNRVKFIGNIGINSLPGTILSLGYDNGIKSQKFTLSKNFFVGAAKTFELIEKNYITISAGKWFGGGKVTETPCRDSYDREYWCQNLTAWSDYNPNYPKNYSYIDIKYTLKFNI